MRHSALFVLLAAACTGTIDTGDPMNPPPATDVQVVVRDGQSPQPGVRVIFQDATGAATEAVTDATGAAAAELPDGGSVTVIRTYPLIPGQDPVPAEVYTYVGVRAGDRLALGKPTNEQGNASAVLVKVPEAAKGTVTIKAPCGGGQGTGPLVAITVRDCAPSIGLYVVDGDKQSFFKRTAFSETMDVSLESLVGGLVSSVSATNVAPGSTVTADQRLGADGYDFYSTGAKRIEAAPANVTLPPLTGVEHLVVASISLDNRTQVVATRKPYTQETVIVDASAGLIASPGGLMTMPSAVTWTEEGAGAPDAVIATLSVTRADTMTLDREYIRMIIAPHRGPSLQIPFLPGAAAVYNPTEDDQIGTALGLVQATGGYDSLRPRAFAVPSIVDATPVDGRITLSYSGSAPGI